jgi:S23 ribosomal protein.
MNSAVKSIFLNIAEGSAKSSKKAFNYHLGITTGSTVEVVAASCLAAKQAYTDDHEHKALYDEGQKLAKSLNAFRTRWSEERGSCYKP